MNGHISPRLGIRFDTSGPELVVYLPDGKPFVTPDAQAEEHEKAIQRADALAAKLREMGVDPDKIKIDSN
jgi:hypothetical protein